MIIIMISKLSLKTNPNQTPSLTLLLWLTYKCHKTTSKTLTKASQKASIVSLPPLTILTRIEKDQMSLNTTFS